MRPFLHTLRESQDGQAVVELALVLPVLLLVLLGIVDFGRAVNYWNDETHLANVAARYAAVGGTGGTCNGTDYSKGHTLTEYVQCEAGIDSAELKNSSGTRTGVQGSLAVCVSIPEPIVGASVTVKVTAKYSWLPEPKVLGGSFKFAETPISGTATMRLEQVPPSSLGYQTAPC